MFPADASRVGHLLTDVPRLRDRVCVSAFIVSLAGEVERSVITFCVSYVYIAFTISLLRAPPLFFPSSLFCRGVDCDLFTPFPFSLSFAVLFLFRSLLVFSSASSSSFTVLSLPVYLMHHVTVVPSFSEGSCLVASLFWRSERRLSFISLIMRNEHEGKEGKEKKKREKEFLSSCSLSRVALHL